MKIEKGSFTISATGESGLLNFEDETLDPDFFIFSIGPRTSTDETHAISSDGWQDINLNRKCAKAVYASSTLRGTRRSTSESFIHYKDVSGTLTKAIGGYVSYTEAGGFKYTASAADSAYTVDFIAIQT